VEGEDGVGGEVVGDAEEEFGGEGEEGWHCGAGGREGWWEDEVVGVVGRDVVGYEDDEMP